MKFFEIYYEIYYEINKNNTEYFFFDIVIKLRVVKVLNIILFRNVFINVLWNKYTFQI